MPPVLGLVILLFAALGAFLIASKGFDPTERRYALAALVAHGIGSVALTLYYSNGEGDLNLYLEHGANIARLLHYDFFTYFPEVENLILHRDNALPVEVLLEGTSTGSMSGIAGLVCSLMGESPYAANFLVSTFAFFGQVALYRALRPTVTKADRSAVLVSMLFVPSAIFWTSGILKEAVLVGFSGVLAWAIARTLRKKSILAALVAIVAAVGVGLIKAYLLLPLVLAVAGWIYVARSGERIALGYKFLAVGLAIAGLFAMTKLFPEYDVEHIADGMQTRRDAAITIAGGSNVDIGAGAQRTLAGQLAFAPLALVNTLFRPFIVEVRNAGQLMAGLETTAILWFAGQLVVTNRLGAAAREIRRTPMLFASLIFVLAFSVGVGLATTNLGTLSRYRVPMMPAYVMILLVLRSRFAPSKVMSKKGSVLTRSRARALAVRTSLGRNRQ